MQEGKDLYFEIGNPYILSEESLFHGNKSPCEEAKFTGELSLLIRLKVDLDIAKLYYIPSGQELLNKGKQNLKKKGTVEFPTEPWQNRRIRKFFWIFCQT